jgi:hypothetical protein
MTICELVLVAPTLTYGPMLIGDPPEDVQDASRWSIGPQRHHAGFVFPKSLLATCDTYASTCRICKTVGKRILMLASSAATGVVSLCDQCRVRARRINNRHIVVSRKQGRRVV